MKHLAEYGDPSDPDAVIFPGPEGRVLRPDVFRRRSWARALRDAGLDETRTPHNLRDTFVTQAHADGFTESEIMAIGGWDSATVMRSRYRGVFESGLKAHDEAADATMRKAIVADRLSRGNVVAIRRETGS